MDLKKLIQQKAMPLLLAVASIISNITIFPSTVHAAGWLGYAQNISLGTAVHGSMKEGDYYGLLENGLSGNGQYKYFWHVYKFSMPQSGLLDIAIESGNKAYFYGATSSVFSEGYNGFAIFSGSDPDNLIWRSCRRENTIGANYSASRNLYYGSTEISLGAGDYYFTVRQMSSTNTPYYLTLSYKEPVINVTSISLSPSKMKLVTGTQKTITATVLPNNATDKTLTWHSDAPSVAVVDDGKVTALSVGKASIVASSPDGEITATCTVTVTCPHDYRTAFVPATRKANGRLTEKCSKCGDIRQERVINAIGDIVLTKKSFTYNGKVQTPSVIVQDIRGKTLTHNKDYTVSYIGNLRDVGRHSIRIRFRGDYAGTANQTFTILPKPTDITKLTPKKKSFTVNWKKQAVQTTGYELAYSTDRRFSRKNTQIIPIDKNKLTKKTVSKLKSGARYHVRIRTYKTIKTNGRTSRLYSGWSKVKTVTTKR